MSSESLDVSHNVLGPVLITYGCVINHPKTQWLGITTVIYFIHDSAVWLEFDGADPSPLCTTLGP